MSKMSKYEPNGNKEEVSLNILHITNGYYVSNEGTKRKPNYHVWIPNGVCCKCDSAYSNLSLAVARCNYLSDNN